MSWNCAKCEVRRRNLKFQDIENICVVCKRVWKQKNLPQPIYNYMPKEVYPTDKQE